jgi:hypothetical protein
VTFIVDDEQGAALACIHPLDQTFPRRLIAEEIVVLLVYIEGTFGLVFVIEQARGRHDQKWGRTIRNQLGVESLYVYHQEAFDDLAIFSCRKVGVRLRYH